MHCTTRQWLQCRTLALWYVYSPVTGDARGILLSCLLEAVQDLQQQDGFYPKQTRYGNLQLKTKVCAESLRGKVINRPGVARAVLQSPS